MTRRLVLLVVLAAGAVGGGVLTARAVEPAATPAVHDHHYDVYYRTHAPHPWKYHSHHDTLRAASDAAHRLEDQRFETQIREVD